ncbi:lysophospholipid acyltransferase family protein [Kingella negevensis]|uniref:lysophospholipid acyltransferase family protein n=1 Tax=Kingella negevensis TaxID=1522312 RepID=UPI00254D67C5|nr:lysophospholipid acyltransferase family protein [Kingella negevensis]MDK4689159.1 lysophospholipid acyltransferase family protein [Kingella negevensis]
MKTKLLNIAAKLFRGGLYLFVAFITGIRPKFDGDIPFATEKKVYFANHNSHGDFVMVWISLPKRWRTMARPVAGADYWLKGKFRRFISNRVFNGLLIMRNGNDPKSITKQMSDAINENSSLIIFPEGTRNTSDDILLLPFKSGIYHLAKANPEIGFVPIWIDNIKQVLPKGKLVPVPMLCDVHIGNELFLQPEESKDDFLQRARAAMLDLVPPEKKVQYKEGTV